MTVLELIQTLQKLPPSDTIYIEDYSPHNNRSYAVDVTNVLFLRLAKDGEILLDKREERYNRNSFSHLERWGRNGWVIF